MPRLDIKIDKKSGEITVEADGYQGVGCVHALELLQSLTGLKTVSEENKDEQVHTVECLRART